ncbi:hypothetical protein L1887_20469 [Cichorium endivia]|nr:hypothetical protein L1887_20469 [Cichorium endivia]
MELKRRGSLFFSVFCLLVSSRLLANRSSVDASLPRPIAGRRRFAPPPSPFPQEISAFIQFHPFSQKRSDSFKSDMSELLQVRLV